MQVYVRPAMEWLQSIAWGLSNGVTTTSLQNSPFDL